MKGRPTLHVIVELEELPLVRFEAETADDEERLRVWLDAPVTQARLTAALLDALEAAA